ncbi:MAG TPA: hypothetical protein PKK05_24365 [Leptospiraceae bacterium]|nr:hypothetical protein [Leptospiraceae bacterium]
MNFLKNLFAVFISLFLFSCGGTWVSTPFPVISDCNDKKDMDLKELESGTLVFLSADTCGKVGKIFAKKVRCGKSGKIEVRCE